MNDLELARKDQYLIDVRAQRSEEKRKTRAELDKAMKTYLAKGGTVTELPGTVFKPRQPHKKPKPQPKVNQDVRPYFSYKYNTLLRKWCAEKVGRSTILAQEASLSPTWVSMRSHGYYQLLLIDWEEISPVMKRIEHDEQMAEKERLCKLKSNQV